MQCPVVAAGENSTAREKLCVQEAAAMWAMRGLIREALSIHDGTRALFLYCLAMRRGEETASAHTRVMHNECA